PLGRRAPDVERGLGGERKDPEQILGMGKGRVLKNRQEERRQGNEISGDFSLVLELLGKLVPGLIIACGGPSQTGLSIRIRGDPSKRQLDLRREAGEGCPKRFVERQLHA